MNTATLTITRDGKQFAMVNTTTQEAPAGHVVISSNLRETKGSTVTAETRYRNVIIPEIVLPESVEKKFAPILVQQFYSLAKSYLDDVMEQTNRMAKDIPLTAFSVNSLVEYFSKVAVSGRLSGEQVAAWFDASATGRSIREKIKAKNLDAAAAATLEKKYRDLFIKTASPNHGINPNTCTVLLTMLDDADSESTVYEACSTRWAATVKKSQASEVDAL